MPASSTNLCNFSSKRTQLGYRRRNTYSLHLKILFFQTKLSLPIRSEKSGIKAFAQRKRFG